jgi:hypothetical protein
MGVPTSEVSYISATTGRGDHEVHKGHVVALGGKNIQLMPIFVLLLAMSRVGGRVMNIKGARCMAAPERNIFVA